MSILFASGKDGFHARSLSSENFLADSADGEQPQSTFFFSLSFFVQLRIAGCSPSAESARKFSLLKERA